MGIVVVRSVRYPLASSRAERVAEVEGSTSELFGGKGWEAKKRTSEVVLSIM